MLEASLNIDAMDIDPCHRVQLETQMNFSWLEQFRKPKTSKVWNFGALKNHSYNSKIGVPRNMDKPESITHFRNRINSQIERLKTEIEIKDPANPKNYPFLKLNNSSDITSSTISKLNDSVGKIISLVLRDGSKFNGQLKQIEGLVVLLKNFKSNEYQMIDLDSVDEIRMSGNIYKLGE